MRRRSPARSHPFSGFTYIEFIVTAAIVAVLFGIVPPLIMNSARFLNISMARLELQRDSRDVSEAILARLRQAVTTTVVVRAKPGQPPCTWIQFQTRSGSTVDFWQQGNELWGSDSVHSPAAGVSPAIFVTWRSPTTTPWTTPLWVSICAFKNK
jgi:type II secretory pathway pseudopilin PulG